MSQLQEKFTASTEAETQQRVNAAITNATSEAAQLQRSTLAETFEGAFASGGDLPCLGRRPNPGQPYVFQSYREVWERARRLGSGLQALCGPSAACEGRLVVGISAPNCPEWVLTDLAALTAGIVVVPLPGTASREATAHILKVTRVDVVVCAPERAAALLQAAEDTALATLVLMAPIAADEATVDGGLRVLALEEVEQMGADSPRPPIAVQGSDAATLVFTSGSTGLPKGVIITYDRWNSVPFWVARLDHPPVVSFAPLSHISERELLRNVLVARGAIAFHGSDMATLFDSIQEVKPQVICAPPRFFTQIFNQYQDALAVRPDTSASDFAGVLGGRVRFMITGSAPTSPEVMAFLRDCFKCIVVNGYGATECSAISSSGRLNPGTEVRLVDVPELGYTAPEGEIWVKTPGMSHQYFNDPAASAASFTEDGWFRTGDVGVMREDGTLQIIDRIKNVFKLAQGEFVAAEALQLTFQECPLVEHVYIHADTSRSFLMVVVVPQRAALEAALPDFKGDWHALCASPQARAHVRAQLQAVGKEHSLQGYEIPRVVLLEPEPFSVEEGLLTESLKHKRRALAAKYGDALSELAETMGGGRAQVLADMLASVRRDGTGSGSDSDSDAEGHGEDWVPLDSLSAVRLNAMLKEQFDVELPIEMLLQGGVSADAVATIVGEDVAVAVAVEGEGKEEDVAVAVEEEREEGAGVAVGAGVGDGIAVVGMSCRFPGGADDVNAFWRLLAEARSAVSEMPTDRWDAVHHFNEDPDVPNCMHVRHGSFVADVHTFDAAFFGVSDHQAETMNPSHRLAIEVTYEALAAAGETKQSLSGSSTGVFVGCSNHDWTKLHPHLHAPPVAAVVASTLGLTGPAVALDTACSSSLVAVDSACRALRTGDCATAVAVGVNVLLHPAVFIGLSNARFLAADGRCKTFDVAADGYVRGEGAGAVVLRRAGATQGAPVLASVLGSAVVQDGKTPGLTVPSGAAQERMMRLAYQEAGVDPSTVSYVECHGTGTALGDPLELTAISRVMGGPTRVSPLVLGACKTNLGHMEAAAGIAAVIKAVLSLRRGLIPANLNLTEINPLLPLKEFPARLPAQLEELPAPVRGDGVRVAGVSANGFGGTNAHVVIAAAAVAPANEQLPVVRYDRKPFSWSWLSPSGVRPGPRRCDSLSGQVVRPGGLVLAPTPEPQAVAATDVAAYVAGKGLRVVCVYDGESPAAAEAVCRVVPSAVALSSSSAAAAAAASDAADVLLVFSGAEEDVDLMLFRLQTPYLLPLAPDAVVGFVSFAGGRFGTPGSLSHLQAHAGVAAAARLDNARALDFPLECEASDSMAAAALTALLHGAGARGEPPMGFDAACAPATLLGVVGVPAPAGEVEKRDTRTPLAARLARLGAASRLDQLLQLVQRTRAHVGSDDGELARRLRGQLGPRLRLPSTGVGGWDSAAVARHAATQVFGDRPELPPVPPIACSRPVEAPVLRLFCLPGLDGGSSGPPAWALALPASVEVYSLSVGGGAESTAAAAQELATALLGAGLVGRGVVQWCLFGQGWGAQLALELAWAVRARADAAPAQLLLAADGGDSGDGGAEGCGEAGVLLHNAALAAQYDPAAVADEAPLACPISAWGGDAEAWSQFTTGAFSERPGEAVSAAAATEELRWATRSERDDKPVVFITGCSTGLGRAMALHFAKLGVNVVATARNPSSAACQSLLAEGGSGVELVALDTTKPESVASCMRHIEGRFGRVDVLINNAGVGTLGALEDMHEDALRWVFEVNLFGTLAVTRATLPLMRRQRSGTVVYISSLTATTVRPCEFAYAASKRAVESAFEALQFEVAHFGIRVGIVVPSFFSGTNIDHASDALGNSPATSPYRPLLEHLAAEQEKDTTSGESPAKFAKKMGRLLLGPDDALPFVSYVGRGAEMIAKSRTAQTNEEWFPAFAGHAGFGWWTSPS